MTSLLEFCNEQYMKNKETLGNYSKLEDFIDDNDKCLDIIYSLLVLPNTNRASRRKITRKERASHIFISFLLGLGIGQFNDLLNKSNLFKPNGYDSEIIWMLTSLIHDYGYFYEKNNRDSDLNLDFNPDLLTDEYSETPLSEISDYSIVYKTYITFDYETIRKYFKLKKTGRLDKDEIIDHGIFGGCKYFASFIKFFFDESEPDRKNYFLLYKTACLMAAQHNIFIPTKNNINIYNSAGLNNLYSNRITMDNPLLLLLSIIDTVECTKRFSRCKNGEAGYLQSSTILNKLKIEVSTTMIIFDFEELVKHINNHKHSTELLDVLESYLKSIYDMNNWTCCNITKLTDYSLKITI